MDLVFSGEPEYRMIWRHVWFPNGDRGRVVNGRYLTKRLDIIDGEGTPVIA